MMNRYAFTCIEREKEREKEREREIHLQLHTEDWAFSEE